VPVVRLLALGVRVDLSVGDGLEAAVAEAWSRCLYDGPLPADVTLSVAESTTEPAADVGGSSPEVVLDNLAMRMNREVATASAGELLMIHAATLCDPASGAVVALSAPSGTGKTTACLTLGRTLGYVSDEICGIASDGTVVPYPKPDRKSVV
jgi:hypothetical protein